MKDAQITCPIKCKDKKTNRCRKTTCEALSAYIEPLPCPCPDMRPKCDTTCKRLKEWHGLHEWRDGVSDTDFKSHSRLSIPTDERSDDTIPQDVINTLSEQEDKRLNRAYERIEKAIDFKGKPLPIKKVIVGDKIYYYKLIRHSPIKYKTKAVEEKDRYRYEKGRLVRKVREHNIEDVSYLPLWERIKESELPDNIEVSTKTLRKGHSVKGEELHKVVSEYSVSHGIPYEKAYLKVSKASRKCKNCNNLIPVGHTLKGRLIRSYKTFCSDACKKAYQRKSA